MSWPDDDIAELVKGERPTLLEAVKGNEVIDALNVLRNMTIEKGTEDEVQFSEDGVKIVYGMNLGEVSGTFAIINANDLTQKISVTVDKGTITEISLGSSGWEEKTITICEDGSAVDYTFLVKS